MKIYILSNIDKKYQTPHICLNKILDNDDKEDIEINLPKNFLSISSWI